MRVIQFADFIAENAGGIHHDPCVNFEFNARFEIAHDGAGNPVIVFQERDDFDVVRDRGAVIGLVVGQGAALVAAGLAMGLLAALVTTRVLRSLLFDVSPSDPMTLGTVIALLAVSAIAASWIPARRAARLEPTEALRE